MARGRQFSSSSSSSASSSAALSTAAPSSSSRRMISANFPTDKELDFMNKHCEIIDATDFYRSTPGTVKLPPIRLQLRNLDKLPKASLDVNVGRIFDIFIRHMLQKEGGNLETTRYWLNLTHPGYRKDGGFWISHKTYKMADGHTLMNTIADQVQSNEALGLDETMSLTMRIFKSDIKGKGGRTPDKILRKFGVKHNHVQGNGYCLLKALIIGKHWSDKKTAATSIQAAIYNSKYLRLTRTNHTEGGRATLQEEEAIELMEDADMDTDVMDHTLEDLNTLVDHLSDYRITVWTMEPGVAFPTIIFDENQQARGFISLYHYDDHFDFFHPSVECVRARFCFKCGSLTKKNHYKNCAALCKRCGFLDCKRGDEQIYCTECNIHFSSQQCFDQHLRRKSARANPHCQVWEKCYKCRKIHQTFKASHVDHICFANRFCKICMSKCENGNHKCSHAKPTDAAKKRALKKQENWTFLIYDFECQVTKLANYQNGVYGMKHLPNLLCYRMICNKCMGGNCATCERGHFSYMTGGSGSVVEQFTKFLITNPKLQNAYILAHNGGRYDHVLCMEQMLKEELFEQKFLLSGTTILSAEVKVAKKNTLTFRDSVKYLQMPLDQLPKAFNLETKSKGTFPYMFNHPDRHHTVLPHHPPAEYYEPSRMSIKKREEFLKWFDEVKDREFDFDKEILSYCQTDVDILTEAIVKFIETCNQTNASKWNPIIQSPTLPSFLMFIMTHEHIADGDVGYIPENGWPGRNNSVFALKYLLWLEREKPWLKLQHKLRRGGEYEAKCVSGGTFYVDGYNEETNEVFEIHGCLWHGCPQCFPNRDAQCPRDRDNTMGELYDKTIWREEQLRSSGYVVHTIWECEIKEMLRRDPTMDEFFKKCRHTHTLRPREAMYGGRTQQFQSIYIANDEYDIQYYDFCSEYPKVNMKGGEYPRGIPQIITFGFPPIVDGQPLPYKGLIFCDVLPPLVCALPVLPRRGNGKLLFPLCATCASGKNPPSTCPHTSVSDRYLTGVWCHDELNLAISEGYTILRYHEVWNWPAEEWFRGGFFESFMKPLLKMKHAASGWPRPDMSIHEKQAHVDAILANDGIELDVDSVVANLALRSLSKLFLNSTWGKFAQNPCKTETRMVPISDWFKAAKFLEEAGYDPKCFEEWGDTHILVSRQPIKDMVTTSRFSNIVYGALTTSAARVDLFNAMKLVGAENLIYCDTDSIIFRQKKGTDPLAPLKGEALGQMTNEVPAGWKISEIVSLAPKVYAYKMVNIDTLEVKYVSKAKGVTLNYENCEKVNFNTMKQLIQEKLAGNDNHITVSKMRMKRGANFLDGLESIDERKRIRCVMDKGIFNTQGQLTPFGHMRDGDLNQDYQFY